MRFAFANAVKTMVARAIMHVLPARAAETVRGRSNLVQHLTPERLAQILDAFRHGYLCEFAQLSEVIMERDITLQTVAPKRIQAVASLDWVVSPMDDSAEAEKHAEAIQYFYDHLTVRHAVKGDERGDIKLLFTQMMSAVPYEYAAHEIVWQPKGPGEMTAEFRFVPLNYFEATTGKLRFLPTEYSLTGNELEEDGWMVTVGPGLMKSCSIAWLFKNRALMSWLIYSGRFGMPGVKGISHGEQGSPEWEQMKEAVRNFYNEFAAVVSPGQDIELIEVANGGTLPFPPLHDAMRAAILALWRGGDLSTQSSGPQATGSNMQQGEAQLLQLGDVQMINGALHEYVTRVVIRYLFGEDVEPLAYIRLNVPKAEVTPATIAADQFLINNGCKLGKRDLMERYGRPEPAKGDEVVGQNPSLPLNSGDTPPDGSAPRAPTEADPAAGRPGAEPMANTIPDSRALSALASDLQPIRQRLANILSLTDPADRSTQLAAFQVDLPKLLEVVNADPDYARALQARLEAAFRAGYAGKVPADLGGNS